MVIRGNAWGLEREEVAEDEEEDRYEEDALYRTQQWIWQVRCAGSHGAQNLSLGSRNCGRAYKYTVQNARGWWWRWRWWRGSSEIAPRRTT